MIVLLMFCGFGCTYCTLNVHFVSGYSENVVNIKEPLKRVHVQHLLMQSVIYNVVNLCLFNLINQETKTQYLQTSFCYSSVLIVMKITHRVWIVTISSITYVFLGSNLYLYIYNKCCDCKCVSSMTSFSANY